MAQPPPPMRPDMAQSSATSNATAQTPAPRPQTGDPPQQSQQQLNGIVLEYLSKKGYNRTEAMLRKESANVDTEGRPLPARVEDQGGRKYTVAYELLLRWVDNVLEIYKPELTRLLWPVFVYSFLDLVGDFYSRDSQEFFAAHRQRFEAEHDHDVRALSTLSLPEHAQQNSTAQLYLNNKYRLSLSQICYFTLIQFLESKERDGGIVLMSIIFNHMDVRSVDRAAAGNERSLAKILAKANGAEDLPAEDEGIPGHHPGSANLDRNAPTVLSKLSLGMPSMEPDLMEDVKAELQEHDAAQPPAAGQNSLTEQFEQQIKREPLEDAPPRDALPYPPSTARDVRMEVQKVKENRDRFPIPHARTGGIGPGVSVCMFTLHNTFDSVNCMEFSGDSSLVAAGTSESYIRVWSLDGKLLTSPVDPASHKPGTSRRLIGHSGPVYGLSFSPSIAIPASGSKDSSEKELDPDSLPLYLLSSSADGTIRLWSLHTWTALVVYKGHQAPIWDVKFSPFGHYFISCSSDRTARLWSTPNIAPLRIFAGHDADVDCIAWHPNTAYVFTGSSGADRTVRMWDIQRGSAVRLFTGHTGNITTLSCSPNGKYVASADDRGEILLWDIAAGRLVKRMRGHSRGGIWSLDWSIESTVIVSAGADGTVRVWDVQPKSEPNGKVISDGSNGVKIDGAAGTTSSTTTTTTSGVKSKSKKDVVVSPDQISAFPTKKSPVYKVHFTQMNLVIAGGAYLPS